MSVRAVDILSQQYFFTSSKLASIATQAEVLAKVRCCWRSSSRYSVAEHLGSLQLCQQRNAKAAAKKIPWRLATRCMGGATL